MSTRDGDDREESAPGRVGDGINRDSETDLNLAPRLSGWTPAMIAEARRQDPHIGFLLADAYDFELEGRFNGVSSGTPTIGASES